MANLRPVRKGYIAGDDREFVFTHGSYMRIEELLDCSMDEVVQRVAINRAGKLKDYLALLYFTCDDLCKSFSFHAFSEAMGFLFHRETEVQELVHLLLADAIGIDSDSGLKKKETTSE